MNVLRAGFRRVLLVLPVVLAMSGAAVPIATADTAEPAASLQVTVEPGAFPVTSTKVWKAPADEIMVWENENILKIDASTPDGQSYVRVELNAAGSAPLQVGTYENVRQRGTDPAAPGIVVVSGGLGCGDDFAEFTVHHIERDAAGKLTAVDVTYDHHCGSASAPIARGDAHFQA
jgi:hypothetical protein